jgi:hypothetical protein
LKKNNCKTRGKKSLLILRKNAQIILKKLGLEGLKM